MIEGKSTPQPTREDEPMSLDISAYQQGVPELVAAELGADVVEPKEFHEFRQAASPSRTATSTTESPAGRTG